MTPFLFCLTCLLLFSSFPFRFDMFVIYIPLGYWPAVFTYFSCNDHTHSFSYCTSSPSIRLRRRRIGKYPLEPFCSGSLNYRFDDCNSSGVRLFASLLLSCEMRRHSFPHFPAPLGDLQRPPRQGTVLKLG